MISFLKLHESATRVFRISQVKSQRTPRGIRAYYSSASAETAKYPSHQHQYK